MKSGGGVLLTSSLQLVVGLVLLGTYEGWKESDTARRRARRRSRSCTPPAWSFLLRPAGRAEELAAAARSVTQEAAV